MRGSAVCGLVASLSTALTAPTASAQTATTTPLQRILYAVSAAAPHDVWAVGEEVRNGRGSTLTRHWNGSQWSDVHSPSPSGGSPVLTGVSARAADDAWAAGYVYAGPGPAPTLVEHWDGHSWAVVASPSPAQQNGLYGVTTIAADDAWAVGYAGKSALALHWDGSAWKRVRTPATTRAAGLDAVTAISASNVWAVGTVGGEGAERTLVEHWNGRAWKRVKSPNPTSSNSLTGVSAASAQSVWAVGSDKNGTLILHWNGHRWRVQSSPNASSEDGLFAVSARSSKNVWAVGDACCTTGGGAKTFTEHWNGHHWRVVASPNPSSSGDILAGVVATHVGKHPWAVGNTGHSDGGAGVLALHWSGGHWVQR